MFAVYADQVGAENPLDGLVVGERPEPDVPDGWTVVSVRAAGLNHHDVWSLKGVGLGQDRLPMILGCDAAGIDENGDEVIVHAVVGDPDWRGDETLDPRRTLLSEKHQGTFAEKVAVPRRNVVPKPSSLSFAEAACLPTAWLTAYRMLFTQAALRPGDAVLVQGAGGGVATAAISLARAAGLRVLATSRDETKRQRALDLGAHEAVESGARLSTKVDAVIDSVGQATWAHSVRSLRPGGTVVVCGATSGDAPSADLTQMFFKQLQVKGSMMGTRDELHALAQLLDVTGVRPVIDAEIPMADAAQGIARMIDGDVFGKIVLTL